MWLWVLHLPRPTTLSFYHTLVTTRVLMEFKAFFVLVMLVVVVAITPPVSALDDNTKISIVYTGESPIKTALAAKTFTKSDVIKTATITAMSIEKYPLIVSDSVSIEKYRCDPEKCAYWINANRGGKTVAVNNPIWLMNDNVPFHVLVSEVEDKKANTLTITVREDLKGSVFQILQDYADRQPLGKPITGTKV